MRRRFRLRIAVVAGVAALAAIAASSALAVVGGSYDGDAHPYVGVIVWPEPNGHFELCSGSLVSSTVMVTAAHCAPPGAQVLVSFDPDAIDTPLGDPSAGWLTGTFHPDPAWCPGCGRGLPGFDTNDLAVVTLDQPVALDRYAQLPSQGYDDSLPTNQRVDIVGFGLQQAQTGPHAPQDFGVRMVATSKIVPGDGSTGDEYLKVSSSKGAICQGDSGGPNLQSGTDTILATSTFGPNTTCQAVAYSERLDTAHALAFVAGFTGQQ